MMNVQLVEKDARQQLGLYYHLFLLGQVFLIIEIHCVSFNNIHVVLHRMVLFFH